MSEIANHTRAFNDRRDLRADDGERLLDALLNEEDENELRSLFAAWNEKGITEDEIYSFASVLRERCVKVDRGREDCVDIVGTGGSPVKSFNVSTAAAFVVAGAGIRVAKHGNRAATSSSGSADLLSALGIEPAGDAEIAQRCLEQVGICFMFAPKFHHLSLTLAKVRRGLGYPTIFNCVGPLCNPAGANVQLIGVWSRELVPQMAGALVRLGTDRAWVVYGENGLDEITLAGRTYVADVSNGAVKEMEVGPEDFRFARAETPVGRSRSADESAEIVSKVLNNERRDSPEESLIVINAAAAIFLAGKAASLPDATSIAFQSLRSGAAAEKARQLAEATRV